MYRKIDVDTLTVEDDQFMEQEFKFTPEQVQAQTSEKESNVKQSLARNDFATALKHALINPPYGPAEVETLKSLCDDLVYQSIAPVKQTEIVKLIKNLSSDEADLLVKYTYKLMAKPSVFNPAILLSWHEKLIAETGHGAIVRCLTDRCQV